MRPELSADRPVLLKERGEGRLVEPQKAHVAWVGQRVLGASDALQILVIEPIDIRMRIPRIPRSTIDLATIHGPEVRDDINVRFCDVR